MLGAYAEEDTIQLTKDEPAKRYKKNQQDTLDQWIIVRLFRCSANRRASLRLESGGQEDAVLLGLLYLGVADDLCTQYLSRQLQADNTLEAGSHILTEITVGISRPQQALASSNRNAAYSREGSQGKELFYTYSG